MKKFKVWAIVEEIDEDNDSYLDLHAIGVKLFDTEEEACQLANEISDEYTDGKF